MILMDVTGRLETVAGAGLVLGLVALLVLALVIVSIVETARWTRKSALELQAIRKLLEQRGSGPDDLPPWLGPQ